MKLSGHFPGSFISNRAAFTSFPNTIGTTHTISIALNAFLSTWSTSFIASVAAVLCNTPIPFLRSLLLLVLFPPPDFIFFFVGVCTSSMNKSSAVFFAKSIERLLRVSRNRSPIPSDDAFVAFVHGTKQAFPSSSFVAASSRTGGNHDTAAISHPSSGTKSSSFSLVTSFSVVFIFALDSHTRTTSLIFSRSTPSTSRNPSSSSSRWFCVSEASRSSSFTS